MNEQSLKVEQIKKQIKDAIELGAQLVGNETTRAELIGMGISLPDGSEIRSWEEFIETVFSEEQKVHALEQVKKLPEIPPLPLPSIVAIYREILRCIALGLNGAAITLSSILIEYMLKFAIYKVEMGGFKKYDPEKADELERTTFQPAIERAERAGLLSKERKATLEEFKRQIRNPYLHYNTKKITAGVTHKDLVRVNTRTGETETIDVKASEDQVIQPGAKTFVDEKRVLEVFEYAHNFVIEMWAKISPLQSK